DGNDPAGGADTPAPTAEATPNTTPTPSSTPTPDRVDITALALEGRTCDEALQVVSEQNADIALTCVAGDPASTEDEQGVIYESAPSGSVTAGTEVTATYYGDLIAIPAPETPPHFSESVITQGGVAQLNWAPYTCPSGTGDLKGYRVSIEGAVFDDAST